MNTVFLLAMALQPGGTQVVVLGTGTPNPSP